MFLELKSLFFDYIFFEEITKFLGAETPFPSGGDIVLKFPNSEIQNAHNYLSKRHMQLLSIFLESTHVACYHT